MDETTCLKKTVAARIGIVATSGEDRTKPYLDTIEAHGGSGVLLKPGVEFIQQKLDGVLLTGGGDLSEVYYDHPLSEEERKTLGKIEVEREKYELEVLKWAAASGKPVLGICRGSQMMNVFAGGVLIPDLPIWQKLHRVSPVIHHRDEGDSLRPAHAVLIQRGSQLEAIFENRTEIDVNTSHHQALARVGHGLQVVAKAPDGVIEAFEDSQKRFWIGVQFHPERMWKKYPIFSRLFNAFLAAAASR